MFFKEPGTKDLLDALHMCAKVLRHIQPQPTMVTDFDDTRAMSDYIDRIIMAAEGWNIEQLRQYQSVAPFLSARAEQPRHGKRGEHQTGTVVTTGTVLSAAA